MTRAIGIKRWQATNLLDTKYDAFIATVGYETRARFVAEVKEPLSDLKFACAFDNNKVHSYFDNLNWYKGRNFEVEERNDDEFELWCQTKIEAAISLKSDLVRLGIDISSMSRFRIASLVAVLYRIEREQPIEVDFFYAPSTFVPPSQDEGPIIVCKPVIDDFAGWSLEPEKPTVVVFGLGYEHDKAIGALEYVEPSSVWAFKPNGEDTRYELEVTIANQAFWECLPKSQVFEYEIDEPLSCFSSLESLLYGKLKSNKPILIPFGPKLFALNCVLAACVYYPSVAVWRVSSGPYEAAVDSMPNGKIIGLRVEFRTDQKNDEQSTLSTA